MVLIKDGQPVDDAWVYVGDDDEVPAEAPAIVTLALWQGENERLRKRNAPLGIRLTSKQAPALIVDDLDRFDVVALEFPKFTNGRAYSYARLLRERYGYRGEIRAVGNVLRDQFLAMHRCGFDAYEVADEKAAAAWHEALLEIGVWYQNAADDRVPAMRLRHERRDDKTNPRNRT